MDKYELFDAAFEEALKGCVAEGPPDYIVKNVTPSKKSLNRVFTGIALSAITLNFWGLDYILPFIGTILSILGLRALRKENKWFFGCYVITVIRALRLLALFAVGSTVYSSELRDAFITVSYFSIPVMFVYLLLLRKGLSTLQHKAGLIPDTKRMNILILWYVLLCILALLQYEGYILVWVMLIAYIFIIRNLYKLSKDMDETGYAVEGAPVKISDRTLTCIIVASVAVICLGANILFGSYDMKWEVQDTAEHTEVQQIKEHLISLGFPSHVLEDMSAEEIKECEGATEVFTKSEDHPVNKGRKVTKTYYYPSGNVYNSTSTVYDVKELRITGVAVKLPAETNTWKLIHHFEWTVNPGFHGTEALQLWTMDGRYDDWRDKTEATGRVLYSKDSITYTAPYYFSGKQTYTSAFNAMFNAGPSRDTFAAFSLPDEGERHRGYLTYEIEEVEDGRIVDSWIHYAHQKIPFMFPVRTALESRMQGRWDDKAFRTVQDALQFDVDTPSGNAEGF
ncbi:MAG: hypothetical protein IJN88_06220 [Clostridia bacterium]|nr:hypothetical protein [Clostridia bacterium]